MDHFDYDRLEQNVPNFASIYPLLEAQGMGEAGYVEVDLNKALRPALTEKITDVTLYPIFDLRKFRGDTTAFHAVLTDELGYDPELEPKVYGVRLPELHALYEGVEELPDWETEVRRVLGEKAELVILLEQQLAQSDMTSSSESDMEEEEEAAPALPTLPTPRARGRPRKVPTTPETKIPQPMDTYLATRSGLTEAQEINIRARFQEMMKRQIRMPTEQRPVAIQIPDIYTKMEAAPLPRPPIPAVPAVSLPPTQVQTIMDVASRIELSKLKEQKAGRGTDQVYSLEELKAFLKAMGLPVSGSKKVLIERIKEKMREAGVV